MRNNAPLGQVPIPSLADLHLDYDDDNTETVKIHAEQTMDDNIMAPDDVALAAARLTVQRPDTTRSSTEPSPTILLQGYYKDKDALSSSKDWGRPSSTRRNRSPYSRSHLRSHSSGAALLSAPPMTRAHSMPNPHTTTTTFTPSTSSSGSLSPNASESPMRSPPRARSPFKAQQQEEGYFPPPRSPKWFEGSGGGSAIEAIQEDSELDITPRSSSTSTSTLPQPSPMHAPSSSRSSSSLRRRPASPLHSLANASITTTTTQQQTPPTSFPASSTSAIDHNNNNTPLHTTPTSASNSPSLGPQRYNEPHPSLHHSASTSTFSTSYSSSIPSTPTSARSRSPSISSLETIEDAPEMESAAIETERIERLKLAAERAERGEELDNGGEKRRSSLDVPGLRTGFGGSSFSRGVLGRTSERKRWSICGGERRADLDLETIWED